MSVAVTDKVSGLAGGQIEVSRQGSGSWQALATVRSGSRLVARIDDARLPAGAYLLRATARDQAANQNSTDKLLDGRPMVINLPLRVPTLMRAGLLKKRTGRRERSRAERRKARRRRETLVTRARVEFGGSSRIVGHLENRDGQPVAGAAVQVFSSSSTVPEQQVGTVQTNGEGRFSYAAPATASRTYRFVYGGTPLMLPAQSQVTVLVKAGSTIRARPRSLRNGRAVRFYGTVAISPRSARGQAG